MARANIAFGIGIALLLGICIAGLHLSFGWSILAALLFFIIGRFARNWPIFPLTLITVAFFFGNFYYHFYFEAVRANESFSAAGCSGVIVSEPAYGKSSQSFTVRMEGTCRGETRVITDPSLLFKYGDLLTLQGAALPPISERDPAVFLYPKISVIGEHHGSAVRETLLGLKQKFIDSLKPYLSSDEAALAEGFTLGERTDFSPELTQAMSSSGVTHLVALSGYNIAVLVFAVSALLTGFLGRRARFWVITAFILLFVVMVGAAASILRAAIMGFLALLAKETGRLYGMRNALTGTALMMALFEPGILFTMGFILTFASLLGIIFLKEPLASLFKKRGAESTGIFLDGMTTTVGAQLAVLPVIASAFGSFSLTAFLANIILVPLMPLTMFFSFLLGFFGMFASAIGVFIGWAVSLIIGFELFVIRFFARFALPVSGVWFSWFFLTLYYIILIGWVWWYAYRRNETI